MEFFYLEILAKTFIIPSRQIQFVHEKISHNASSSRIANAMNINSAFIGSYIENLFWYPKIHIRQIRILRGAQLIEDFDAADNCRLFVTAMKALNFEDDIPSLPIDSFKDDCVLVFDLTSMQDATENCQYPELVGEPLRLRLNFTFTLKHFFQLIALGERVSSVAVDKFDVPSKKSELDNFSLRQKVNRTALIKYWFCCSFLSDYAPTVDGYTFANMNTQPSKL